MGRPSPYLHIKNLPIGGEATERPETGETPEKALKRLKDRFAKYAKEGLHFRAKIDGDVIRVQRTREGHNTKVGDWLMMKAGDRLLLKTSPTPADIKKARGSCDYMATREWNKIKHLSLAERHYQRIRSASWSITPDRQGRLVVECWTDVDGKEIDNTLGDAAPLRTLWTGEWP
ncbi:hypothetical protein [Sphingomonas sp. PB1R3]|uniref:hypothetical protein n=1 Tax=Sphingomonas flavida TaxID=3096154 RepID=UPI002FC7DD5B